MSHNEIDIQIEVEGLRKRTRYLTNLLLANASNLRCPCGSTLELDRDAPPPGDPVPLDCSACGQLWNWCVCQTEAANVSIQP